MDQMTDSGARARRELARFLKAMRERISPVEAGVAVTPRRRAKGLLREEVAQAAGVSVTWYTWMEQARPTNPSLRVLDGLARALRLDATERAHLVRLARPDLRPAATRTAALSAPLDALLHGLAPHPAYAFNARWDVIAWNAPAACLLGAFAPGRDNVLRRLFLDPGWRSLFAEWDAIARSAVAQFRASTAHLLAEPDLADLVAELQRESPAFAGLWAAQGVEAAPVWMKTLDHPEAGRLRFTYASFQPDSTDEGLRFTIYTPADAQTKQRARALLDQADASVSARRAPR
jgi:transcriptional regulator with XRE-family HTH domain